MEVDTIQKSTKLIQSTILIFGYRPHNVQLCHNLGDGKELWDSGHPVRHTNLSPLFIPVLTPCCSTDED